MSTYKAICKDAIMIGYNFHFGQCQYRTFCEYGLKNDYTTNENLWFSLGDQVAKVNIKDQNNGTIFYNDGPRSNILKAKTR